LEPGVAPVGVVAIEQKVIPRRLSIDELFDETTAALAV
jgi:hypothetical protein